MSKDKFVLFFPSAKWPAEWEVGRLSKCSDSASDRIIADICFVSII